MSILQFIKDHFTQTDHSHLVSQDGQSILSNWEIGGHHVQVVFYVQNDEFLMIRVGDLQRSIDFYTQVLGMRLLRKSDYPSGRFTNAFVGYDDESRTAVLELTHNWDTASYDMGSGFGHVAVEVEDAYKTCDEVKKRGGKVTREPGPMKHGATVIAFVEDPDGYKIELIQRA